jgi:hypothetical protein
MELVPNGARLDPLPHKRERGDSDFAGHRGPPPRHEEAVDRPRPPRARPVRPHPLLAAGCARAFWQSQRERSGLANASRAAKAGERAAL